jgi:signal transduction histidine kinase/HAMP domain-containing protein
MSETPDHAVPKAAQAWPGTGLALETALSAARPLPAAGVGPVAGAAQRRPLGLRAGLWWLIAIALLPALAGTVWHLLQLRQIAMRDAYAKTDLMAAGTAEALRWVVQDAQAMVAAVAARPRVRAMDPGNCDPLFQDFQTLSPSYNALALRRIDGESVCSELAKPPTRASVAATPWFQAAVQQGSFRVSGVHPGTVRQPWAVRITQPVLGAGGQMEGLLVSPLDLKQLHRRLFARLPAHARVAVVDGSNRLVLQSQQQDQRAGKQAVANVAQLVDQLRRDAAAKGGDATLFQFAETGFDSTRRLFSMRPVPLTDWVVVASLPEDETLQGYRVARNRTLAAALLVLLLAVLAAWRVKRGITEPMQGLASAARDVAAGDDSRRAPEVGPHEIAAVAREFNRMVAANAAASAQLRAGEQHYRTLIENLPVAVVAHRPDSTVEVFNDRACNLLRMSAAQMEGRSAMDHAWCFVDAQGQRLPPAANPVNRLLQTQQPLLPVLLGIATEPPGDAPPEVHTWVMVTGYPQFDGPRGLQRVIVAFVDVSVQREAEALRLAKESAEAASAAKTAFLSRVSHELRTPLNAINGFSELVLMDPQLPPASKDKVQHVLTAGRHLLSLINQVLDLTQLEAGGRAAPLQAVALWPLLAECVALCEPLAQARGVTLELASMPLPSPWVLAEQTPLRQVLINLLSNAVKYNRPQGRVHIHLSLADAGSMLALHVQDTGPGLSEAQQAALFQPFNRLGAEYSGVEGHGLGLSIARMLAQAMGGEITVHSVVGEGATFTLQLQRAVSD